MIAYETTVQHRHRKLPQKLTIIGHHAAFNEEQSPYCIVSHKKSPKKTKKKKRPYVCTQYTFVSFGIVSNDLEYSYTYIRTVNSNHIDK